MKKIEVPSEDVILKINDGEWDKSLDGFIDGFKTGIAYANTQLANEVDFPWLTDGEIEKKFWTLAELDAAKWARDWYEKQLTTTIVPQWRPKPGDKCAFFNVGDSIVTIGEYQDGGENPRYCCTNGFAYNRCFPLESLDEIGKPPSYFVERGRCTQGTSK